VMEDGHAEPMPVIQAIQRRPLESAASGNVRAQRDIKRVVARACPGHPIAFLPPAHAGSPGQARRRHRMWFNPAGIRL